MKMRKRTGVFMLALVMGSLLVTGCGKFVYVDSTEQMGGGITEQITQEGGISEEPQTEANADNSVSGEETPVENTEAGSSVQETPVENTDTGSSDVTPVEASLEKPAQFGEWVESQSYSAQDSKDHTMYFRITGVITGAEAQKIVDDYNSAGHAVVISDLDKDDLEYRVVTYETYFPADFPQADYGITNVDVHLQLCNLEDAGAIAGYIGLSTVWDISKEPDINEFYAGNTFKDGKAVFAMVKGSSDYLFKCEYSEGSMQGNHYVKGQ